MSDVHIDDSELIAELLTYYFPDISVEELASEPYKTHISIYCQLFKDFKFYRGFIGPTPIERAKIYRAIDLCCRSNRIKDGPKPDFIVFAAPASGLIIKSKFVDSEVDSEFDSYLRDSDSLVFIPEGCDQLDKYELTYMRRLIANFLSIEKIPAKVLDTIERPNFFIFIYLTQPYPKTSWIDLNIGNAYLEKLWKEYLQGGVLRTFLFEPHQLRSVFQTFGWHERVSFRTYDEQIEITVRSPSVNDFEQRINLILAAATAVSAEVPEFIELSELISDEYEALGIVRILNEFAKEVYPLIRTNRIYSYSSSAPAARAASAESEIAAAAVRAAEEENQLQQALLDYIPSDTPVDDLEIFTQEDFVNMSKYRKASLIKSPWGTYYSLLDLWQNSKQVDPLTRKEFPEDFKSELNQILDSINPIFLNNFTLTSYEPELVTIVNQEGSISFYLKIKGVLYLFWHIPDLRETEDSSLTLLAIQTLLLKWSDRTLFRKLTPCVDKMLIFSPPALYVFEKTFMEGWSTEKQLKAEQLQEHINTLQKCA